MAAITLPNNGVKTGYLNGSSAWGPDMNRNLRILDALANLRVVDKDLSAPPGSPTTGQVYIVGASATGAWAGQSADTLAIYETGDDVTSGWFFLAPKAGWRAYVIDEAKFYRFGTAWLVDSGQSPVVTEAATSVTAMAVSAGNYSRFTNAAAKTYSFLTTENLVVGSEFHGRNVGAGDLTLTAGSGFTLNPPASGLFTVPAGASFTVKIVATNTGDIRVG